MDAHTVQYYCKIRVLHRADLHIQNVDALPQDPCSVLEEDGWGPCPVLEYAYRVLNGQPLQTPEYGYGVLLCGWYIARPFFDFSQGTRLQRRKRRCLATFQRLVSNILRYEQLHGTS